MLSRGCGIEVVVVGTDVMMLYELTIQRRYGIRE
jgi:hypothetical protein